MTATIEIIENPDVSIAELASLQDTTSVMRSAHVGNLRPYNLTIAEAGIPVLAVDHNVTGVDSNYLPEMRATREDGNVIAETGKVTCRLQTEDGEYLDEAHLGAVRKAISGAEIFTNSTYLQRNESAAEAIVQLGLREFPQLFTRFVRADGSVERTSQGDAKRARLLGMLQLGDVRERATKALMPNLLNIVANFAIEAANTQSDTVYHLSGPDMVRYIGEMKTDINVFYQRLAETTSFGARLPQSLKVHLVPAANARFATTFARKELLDTLLETYELGVAEKAEIEAARRAFFTSDQRANPEATQSFITKAGAQRAAVDQRINNAIDGVPEIFVGSREAGFVSQYDVLQEGGLYVSAMNRTKTMAELAALSSALAKLRKKAPR